MHISNFEPQLIFGFWYVLVKSSDILGDKKFNSLEGCAPKELN